MDNPLANGSRVSAAPAGHDTLVCPVATAVARPNTRTHQPLAHARRPRCCPQREFDIMDTPEVEL